MTVTRKAHTNTATTMRRRTLHMASNRSTFWKLLAITAGIVLGVGGGMALAARNSSGTYSLPYSAFVPGTTISAPIMNSTLSDIGTELSDSLSRSGKGGMTAPFRVPDGTVAAPALSFTNETSSGVYRIGASNVGIAVAGSKRFDCNGSTACTVSDPLIVTGSTTLQTTLGVTGVSTLSDNVILAKAGAQTVTHSGGTLQVGTSDANDVQLVRAGAAFFGTTSTSLDAITHPIINVVDPTNAQDAATKNYVDVTAGTSLATNSALMRRDASGRVAVAAPSASGDAANKAYVDAQGDQPVQTTVTCSTTGATLFTINYNLGTKIRFAGRFYMPAGPSTFAFRCTPSTTAVSTLYIEAKGSVTTVGSGPAITATAGTSTNTTAALSTGSNAGILEVNGAAYVLNAGSTGSITCQCITTGSNLALTAGSWYSYGFDNP